MLFYVGKSRRKLGREIAGEGIVDLGFGMFDFWSWLESSLLAFVKN